MNKLSSLVLLILISKLSYSQNVPQWEWATNASITSTNQISNDICVDASSNIFISGFNEGQAVYGSDVLEPGNFIAKYDPEGNVLWAKRMDVASSDIQCDEDNNLYVIGNYSGSIKIDKTLFTSNGGQDFFVIKYRSDGTLVWARSFGGVDGDAANSLIVDSEGNSFITGFFGYAINFDGWVFNYPEASWRSFVIKLNHSGTTKWARAGRTKYLEGVQIKRDKIGSVYVLGHDFIDSCQMACHGSFVSKYSSDGTLLMDKPHIISSSEEIFDFNLGSNNDILILHYYGRYSPYKLSKFDSTMNLKWSKFIGSGFCFQYTRIITDIENNIYAMGRFHTSDPPCKTISIGTDTFYRKSLSDLLISKYDPDGNHIWSINEGGKGSIAPFNWTKDPSGNLLINAICNGNNSKDTVYFSSDTIINDGSWTQIFVAKLKINDVIVTNLANTIPPEHNLSLYPNPSPGKFTISGISGKSKICVYDISGRCVYTRTSLTESEIDLSGKEKGIYFLEAIAENGTYRKKLVIE